jgi:hypothetical protein
MEIVIKKQKKIRLPGFFIVICAQKASKKRHNKEGTRKNTEIFMRIPYVPASAF